MALNAKLQTEKYLIWGTKNAIIFFYLFVLLGSGLPQKPQPDTLLISSEVSIK